MINIRSLRVVQKVKKHPGLVAVDGTVFTSAREEMTEWKLQYRTDALFSEWEDVQVIMEYEDE